MNRPAIRKTLRGTPNQAQKGKGLIRSLNRRATSDEKTHAGEAHTGRLREPSACERCGAVFMRRRWRQGHYLTLAMLDRADWTVCPACEQARGTRGGADPRPRAVRGSPRTRHPRAHPQHGGARGVYAAAATRGLGGAQGDVLEVLTTSQKLAHRIVHELKKVFRGSAAYHWSDDGILLATWRRER